jgi:hypothetical protein
MLDSSAQHGLRFGTFGRWNRKDPFANTRTAQDEVVLFVRHTGTPVNK